MYTCLCPTQFADLVRHALQILSSDLTFSSLCIYRKKTNGDDGAKGTATPPGHTALLGLRPKTTLLRLVQQKAMKPKPRVLTAERGMPIDTVTHIDIRGRHIYLFIYLLLVYLTTLCQCLKLRFDLYLRYQW
jgi:hypothetical protein